MPLTGTNISSTYKSLLRVNRDAGVHGTLEQVEDGLGTDVPIEIATETLRISPPTTDSVGYCVFADKDNNTILSIDSVDNFVGIGVTNPDTLLHIAKTETNGELIAMRLANTSVASSSNLNSKVSIQMSPGNEQGNGAKITVGKDSDFTSSPGGIDTYMAFQTVLDNTLTEKVRISSDGKVGIGTTDPAGLLEIASATSNRPIVYITNTSTTADDLGGNLIFRKSDGALASNTHLTDDDVMGDITFQACDSSDDAWTSSVNIRGKIDGTPTTNQVPGQLVFSTNSGSTSVTDRMWIKADGKVGIGAETPGAELEVRGPTGSGFDSAGELRLSTAETSIGSGDLLGLVSFSAPVESDGTDSILPAAAIGCIANAAFDADQNEGELTFYTAGSETALASGQERMRITYDGKVGIGENAPDNRFHVTLADGSDNTFVAKFENQDADNPQGIALVHSGVDLSSDNTADHTYLQCSDSNSGVFSIYGDGDWDTEDGSEQASDRRIKKNIADVSSKLEDVLKLKVRNFNKCMPDGSDLASTKLGRKRVGFIADELMEVFPGLVQSKPAKWMGTDYTDLKRVRMSPLIPILVKAIQELSAKVTALESA